LIQEHESMIPESKAHTLPAAASAAPAEGVSRRRRSAPLIENMVLVVIQLAATAVIMAAIGTWINAKWAAFNSALP
jgi:hypothetical protein